METIPRRATTECVKKKNPSPRAECADRGVIPQLHVHATDSMRLIKIAKMHPETQQAPTRFRISNVR